MRRYLLRCLSFFFWHFLSSIFPDGPCPCLIGWSSRSLEEVAFSSVSVEIFHSKFTPPLIERCQLQVLSINRLGHSSTATVLTARAVENPPVAAALPFEKVPRKLTYCPLRREKSSLFLRIGTITNQVGPSPSCSKPSSQTARAGPS